MERFNILQVGKSTAGIGMYLRWLADGLDAERFRLTFVCLSDKSEELALELRKIRGINALSFRMNRYRIDLFSDLGLVFALARLIRANQFDLIHAHGSKAGFLVRIAAIGTRQPVVYSPHCFSFHVGANPIVAKLFALVERLCARFLTTRIMTVSDGEQILARKFAVGRSGQFKTIHSGVDIERYRSKADPSSLRRALNIPLTGKIVGAIGRLGKQKAPQDFVRMAGMILSEMPDCQFVWAGDGPLSMEVKRLSDDLGISDNLHFLGEYQDIPALLSVMDCFVLASYWEGFPIVLLEAMAAGVPVVATDIPGNDEAVQSGTSGWLVPPGDVAGLSTKVLQILRETETAQRFAKAGRQRILNQFSRTTMLDSIEAFYCELAEGNQVKK